MGNCSRSKRTVSSPCLLSVVSGASSGFRPTDDQWDSLVVKKLAAGLPLSQAMIDGAPPGTPVPSAEQRAMMSRMDAAEDSRALGAQRLGNAGLYVDYKLFTDNRVPVLLMVGSRDGPERFAELRAALPNATFVVIEGAGHGSAVDRPEFLQALRSFFDRHS